MNIQLCGADATTSTANAAAGHHNNTLLLWPPRDSNDVKMRSSFSFIRALSFICRMLCCVRYRTGRGGARVQGLQQKVYDGCAEVRARHVR